MISAQNEICKLLDSSKTEYESRGVQTEVDRRRLPTAKKLGTKAQTLRDVFTRGFVDSSIIYSANQRKNDLANTSRKLRVLAIVVVVVRI
jgi:hypothetical protein